jgi:hypothetical protein
MLPYRSLLDRLQTQHEAIDVIIGNVGPEKLIRNPAPGKWSIKDNIAHLAKYQTVFIDRINRITSGKNPLFESYVAEKDAAFPEWQKWDLQTLMDRLYADRQLIFTLVNGYSCTQIETTGKHQRFGEMTVVQWTEFFLLHEAHHLYTIFQLTQSSVG